MKSDILKKVDILYIMWKKGSLGGEFMPEDENPHLDKSSKENYLYFTLPMALNYQRNSYSLWESANKTWNDKETNFVFNPKLVLNHSFEEVQYALTKYKVALQKNKQTEIWIKLCNTFVELFDGDIRNLFDMLDNDINKIKEYIQKTNKKSFPYLCGTKICNYWLYVIWQYTDRKFKNIENLTVAADTHVIKATYRLGLITEKELNRSDVQLIVIDRWEKLFKGTKYKPIDIHTALWLWSRNGFKELDESILNEEVFKNKVKESYERNNYIEDYRKRELLSFERDIFDQVISYLPKNGSVLDLGCGSGYPYDRYFVDNKFNLTGVDFSTKHINQAKHNNPSATYIEEDIEKFNYATNYDLIMMLFSLLHIPREHHKEILKRLYNHLNDNGILLLTLRDEDVGNMKYRNDFCGDEMYWSYYSYDKYIELLNEIGFKVLYSVNQNKFGISESHNWLILKKGE